MLQTLPYWLYKTTTAVNSQDRYKKTPLHLAISTRNFPLISTLLQHKASLTLEDKDGATPLMLALAKGRFCQDMSLIKLLAGYSNEEELEQLCQKYGSSSPILTTELKKVLFSLVKQKDLLPPSTTFFPTQDEKQMKESGRIEEEEEQEEKIGQEIQNPLRFAMSK